MSVPPKFADIGKSANDLLSKDYPIGVAKLEVKTTTANGVCFTVNGSEDTKTQTIVGDLKTKYVDKKSKPSFYSHFKLPLIPALTSRRWINIHKHMDFNKYSWARGRKCR